MIAVIKNRRIEFFEEYSAYYLRPLHKVSSLYEKNKLVPINVDYFRGLWENGGHQNLFEQYPKSNKKYP